MEIQVQYIRHVDCIRPRPPTRAERRQAKRPAAARVLEACGAGRFGGGEPRRLSFGRPNRWKWHWISLYARARGCVEFCRTGRGSRPGGCPGPMRRSWLRRNRLTRALPQFPNRGAGGLSAFRQKSLHFFGETPERRPWARKREDAPGRFCRALPNRFSGRDTRCAYTGEYPIPPSQTMHRWLPLNLRNRPANSLRTSGGK
jgi:hypothetical protein